MSHSSNRRRQQRTRVQPQPIVRQQRRLTEHLRHFCVQCAEALTVEIVVLVVIRISISTGAISLAAIFTR